MKLRHLVILAAASSGWSCNRPFEPVAFAPAPGTPRFSVSTRVPERLLGVIAPVRSPGSDTVEGRVVDCATCHAQRLGQPLKGAAGELELFHKGFKVEHGSLACDACHVQGQGEKLHLATGEAIATAEALKLCAQCHGPQHRDFQHGAHGGAVGAWDLSRGGREKNHCVDCHDPHGPKFIGGEPAPGPRLRTSLATGASHD